MMDNHKKAPAETDNTQVANRQIKQLIIATPCHVVLGFLGAGKTSFINACVEQWQAMATAEPQTSEPQSSKLQTSEPQAVERWAILVNEAGKIGIDKALFAHPDALAIREVSGGCICCTSQLPMQIALSRLLAEHRPDRLWIEPTGLAHPQILLEQLNAPHWQTALRLNTVFCVLSAEQWQQSKYQTHEGYQAHVRYSDVVVVNRHQGLDEHELAQLGAWIHRLNPTAQIYYQPMLADAQTVKLAPSIAIPEAAQTMMMASGLSVLTTEDALLDLLHKPSQVPRRSQAKVIQPLGDGSATSEDIAGGVSTITSRQPSRHAFALSPLQPLVMNPAHAAKDSQGEGGMGNDEGVISQPLPYRYQDKLDNYGIIGWRLPAHWQVDVETLTDWLLSLPHWQRIKGVVHGKDVKGVTPYGANAEAMTAGALQEALQEDNSWQTLNFTPDALTTASTQPYFDNRFEIIFAPDAPVVELEPLDKQVLAMFER